jgi:two-component system, chemotaxis family, protein-glutamate methylesterase/glutaminase
MVSSQTETGSETTLRALELGAVDFIGKPRAMSPTSLEEYAEELVEKLRAAKFARIRRMPGGRESVPRSRESTGRLPGLAKEGGKMIFVGASTGGTEALKELLLGFPADCPPILVVQHMPEAFTASFAKRLDTLVSPRVIEAQGGERVESGIVYIAPGHSHLRIKKNASGYVTELLQTPPVNRHRPSVDVLFDSAAELVGRAAFGVILTGMGKDGAQGLLRMRQAGARTFGQDEESCVVYGMPRESYLIGAVEEQLPLDAIAPRVLQVLGRV